MSDYNRYEERRERRRKWADRMDQRHGHGHVWTGLFLLIVGGLALVRSFGVPVPDWLFSWQMLLIGIGLFIGFRKGFDTGGWFVPILIGGAFLVNEYFLDGQLHRHMWPLVLVIVGVAFIFRSFRRPGQQQRWSEKKNAGMERETIALESEETYSEDDFVNTTCIFGSSKKVVLSKNFKGGDLVNIFGGSEVDLTQADLTDAATIEITAMFGGATLIVPSNWEVKSTIVTIFGGINDKRKMPALSDKPGKKLILKGTVVFGGIEIKSY
ncbi:MAG: LiaF domain-containing protein [Chitinophagaceae bacterium]